MASDATIAKSARRSAANEAMLVWSLGGCAICIGLLFLLFNFRSFPIPFGLSFYGFPIASGIFGGAVIAAAYFLIARKSIASAKAAHAEILHAAEAMRDQETKRKIAEMKAARRPE